MPKVDQSVSLHMAIEGEPVRDPDIPTRGYLGYSGMNQECARRVWYSWRFASPPAERTQRKQRIFERGDLEEARVIKDLNAAGMKVFRLDDEGNEVEMTGDPTEEQEEIVGYKGHTKGHPDGRVRGVPLHDPEETMLLEIKTMSKSAFAKRKKIGIKKYSHAYWGQIQIYMGKLGLSRCLYVCTCKDNEERHYEVIDFEPSDFEELERKEEHLVDAKAPPQKAFKMGYFKCDWCPHNLVCHLGKEARVTCRSCRHMVVERNGVFRCGLTKDKLSLKDQIEACKRHSPLF